MSVRHATRSLPGGVPADGDRRPYDAVLRGMITAYKEGRPTG